MQSVLKQASPSAAASVAKTGLVDGDRDPAPDEPIAANEPNEPDEPNEPNEPDEPDDQNAARQDVERYFAEGGSLRELFGLDAAALEVLYTYACQRYETNDHEGARQLFLALAAIDPHGYDYWLSLGLSLQKLHRHDEAIYCFTRCAQLRMWEPKPPYLAGISLQLCGEYQRAAQAYSAAIGWCGEQKPYQELRGLAEQSLRSLQALQPATALTAEDARMEGGKQ
ncbi:SycD/LcrH family type III secretion system chaperone [Cupriavidus gilardii]|uniref:SycD/LcrH family type III secretion system chaperone n=1 Tax=Cupriavidus gilardii TaxID=82541 RepID=UPI001580C052|nr:SycD/LcrH family type III secretion system chaperone [Cupriavidus gilardii]MCT9070518.1 SycD/LcrH family type III secretion system chaperone [Cupriavidus gilardii]QKS61109.1 SycD/LcrH family type III secretion system chaperone [Cupriavidus gilardii]UXC38516.1 SycD/LcrH family type III secretion system chaperone [Cupriavidus gilardii]